MADKLKFHSLESYEESGKSHLPAQDLSLWLVVEPSVYVCCLSYGANQPAAGQTCLTLQTHSAISTSLTSNRSSYRNLKLPLQSTRVRPYSTALVQKNDTPQVHAQTGHLWTLGLGGRWQHSFAPIKTFLVPSAAISLLPRNIHALLWREAKEIAESQRIRAWAANINPSAPLCF